MSTNTFGKYELVSKLASGGMAVAYKALMLGAMGVKKPVVLKLIHPHLAEEREFVDMFIEEARLSATLTHSNIAQVFDFGEVDGRYFIALELVDGQSLAHLLKRTRQLGRPVLPVPLAILIAVEMCEALYYAHTRNDEHGKPLGLVHRDVSPENVLISWQGEVKLVDFGIAKSTMAGKQTATGMVKGKYPYFSPEQSRADRTMDARTDIYATTVVLYEMLCARRPYEGEFHEVMRALLTGDYPLPSSLNLEVPKGLEQLMMKGLALDRAARFRTSREMGQALSQLQHELYPEVQRSDLHSLMSVIYEDELLAAGKPVEVREGFREMIEGRTGLATDHTPTDDGPPGLATGRRKLPAKSPTPSAPPPPERKKPTAAKTAHGAPTVVPDTRIQPGGPGDTADPGDTVSPGDTAHDGDDEPVTDGEPAKLPPGVRMSGSQAQQLSLDSPEKAAARAKAVKLIAGAAAVVFVAVAVLALIFSGGKKDVAVERTPVWFTSVPPGAEVSIDGRAQGKAPMDGELGAGLYTFGMTLEGYRPWTKRTAISGNKQMPIEARLVPIGKDEAPEKGPELPKKRDEQPLTQEAVDAGIVFDQDKRHAYHWPLRSFTLWPQAHTLALSQYKTFSRELEPDTTYNVTVAGSLDLGRAGKTSAVMYYLEGENLGASERWGFLAAGTPKTLKGVSTLYAWVFDDDASDNSGKLNLTFRISKYIPETYATFKAEDHVIVPAETDVLTLDGLLADHHYTMVFRPDDPKVMGAPVQRVLCVHETPRPKPIQKRYVWYGSKHIGELTGVTGMTCMFISFEGAGTSGLLEVDIDDIAELGRKH